MCLKNYREVNFLFVLFLLGLDILQKMLRFDPSKRLTAAQLLEDPYFGDIHDSIDEPICPVPNVFRIEHEVDDLPKPTLLELFLKECCPEKFNTKDTNSDLFDGFDEVFAEDNTNLKDIGKHFQIDSGFSYSPNQSAESSCPSLLNILTSGISDEPCRDPACSEARSCQSSSLAESLEADSSFSGHCSPTFPRVSSFLELSKSSASTQVDPSRPSDAVLSTRNFQRIPRSFLCSVGLDKELIRKLNMMPAQGNCRMSELAVTEHFKTGKFSGQFSHWDTIRIWI